MRLQSDNNTVTATPASAGSSSAFSAAPRELGVTFTLVELTIVLLIIGVIL